MRRSDRYKWDEMTPKQKRSAIAGTASALARRKNKYEEEKRFENEDNNDEKRDSL